MRYLNLSLHKLVEIFLGFLSLSVLCRLSCYNTYYFIIISILLYTIPIDTPFSAATAELPRLSL